MVPGRALVTLHQGLVDPDRAQVEDSLGLLEDALEHPCPRPPAVALIHGSPLAELRWQVAPRSSRAEHPEHSFKGHAVVGPRATGVARLSRQEGFDDLPLNVRKKKSWRDKNPAITVGNEEMNVKRFDTIRYDRRCSPREARRGYCRYSIDWVFAVGYGQRPTGKGDIMPAPVTETVYFTVTARPHDRGDHWAVEVLETAFHTYADTPEEAERLNVEAHIQMVKRMKLEGREVLIRFLKSSGFKNVHIGGEPLEEPEDPSVDDDPLQDRELARAA